MASLPQKLGSENSLSHPSEIGLTWLVLSLQGMCVYAIQRLEVPAAMIAVQAISLAVSAAQVDSRGSWSFMVIVMVMAKDRCWCWR